MSDLDPSNQHASTLRTIRQVANVSIARIAGRVRHHDARGEHAERDRHATARRAVSSLLRELEAAFSPKPTPSPEADKAQDAQGTPEAVKASEDRTPEKPQHGTDSSGIAG